MSSVRTNLRLREAVLKAGFTPERVAEKLQVDPKTVERWIQTGRTPYPRHRYAVAALVGVSVAELFPQSAPQLRPSRTSFAGVCIWCEHTECENADCIVTHESAEWEVCEVCGGAPWMASVTGCGCVFGLVQKSAKFAAAGAVA
ncbi:helix-turn-helix domain-containing protein [Nocardia bovistercoris]|uniref:Helix-turn-helix transcriptional regulator n=1 Tax=Nocardia bovistercoris TaxID=2785916 RepID=A0A931I840_9NOCA|nr:helix-turn-helix transcriptional regulator [Nocardia bovistercoris]MBH0776667.1 helix-turn-helix transcriptional regulator [Nocardia bovistercoris]